MHKSFLIAAGAAVLVFVASPTFAQYPLNPPPVPQTGSSNVAVADLNVSHPQTEPCVVPLFTDQSFKDYTPKPIDYTPPKGCPGPWAKVVFEGDFSVTPGVQFDRTGTVFLGHVNLFFGTTPEPSPDLGPSWHVERDVTDLSALFTAPQTGDVFIGNTVNDTYTGVIKGSASLYFYPAAAGSVTPAVAAAASASVPMTAGVPTRVIPLNSGNTAATLHSPDDRLEQTLEFPTNMTNLYLEVIAQSQSGDEFWYTCVPDGLADELSSCGGTGMRQAEVFIDGDLAGLAPISPWIYTGGIDPYLWFPTPGVQTLNLKPYRLNLTPFVGMLNDGGSHTVSVAVFNDNDYFSVAAALLVFQDISVDTITGGLTQVDVPAPMPATSSTISAPPGGTLNATVEISSKPVTTTSGYIETPAGKVTTTVKQTFDFDNTEMFVISPTAFEQDIAVTNNVMTETTTAPAGGTETVARKNWKFPLAMNISQTVTAEGIDQKTTSKQTYEHMVPAGPVFDAPGHAEQNTVKTTDTLHFDASGNLVGKSDTASSQKFEYQEARNGESLCYDRNIDNADNAVTSVSDDQDCDLLPAPPSLTAPESVTIEEATSSHKTHTDALSFQASGEQPLKITASSSDTTLVSASGIKLESDSQSGVYYVTVYPNEGEIGTAGITLTATDPYGQQASGSFKVTVRPRFGGGGGGGFGWPDLGLLALPVLAFALKRRWFK